MTKTTTNWSRAGVIGIITLVTLCSGAAFLHISDAQGQDVFQKTFEGSASSIGGGAKRTSDGGFIAAGNLSISGQMDVFLLKTNASGEPEWSRSFGGAYDEWGSAVLETQDGGFAVLGKTWSYGAGSDDYFLVKTDSLGNMLWSRTYGSSQSERGWALAEASDGGFVIGGTSDLGPGSVCLVRTDASGQLLWSRSMGNPFYNNVWAVAETPEGGIAVTGAGSNGAVLVKFDGSGNYQWSKSYGGSGDDRSYGMKATNDSGFVLVGMTSSFGAGQFDVYVIRTDSDGNLEWSKTYGGLGADFGQSIELTSDGGFILLGSTESFGAGSKDIYVIRTDALGDTVWTKTYGGFSSDNAYSITQTGDGGFIVSASSASFATGIYMIRMDENGFSGGCNEYNTATVVTVATPTETVVSPVVDATLTGTSTITPLNSVFTQDDSVLCNNCTSSSSPSSNTISAGGGNASFGIYTNSSCPWFANTTDTWITITAGNSGSGDGVISYSVTSNPDTVQRTGTITVLTHVHQVIQEAQPVCGGTPPMIPIIQGTDCALAATGSTGVTYQWYLDGLLLPGATSQFLTASGEGFYTVKITDLAGCSNISDPFYADCFTTVEDTRTNNLDFRVFPNPITSDGIVHFDRELDIQEIVLYNVIGEKVKSYDTTRLQGLIISAENLNPGIYFLKVTTSKGILSSKILINYWP